MLCRAGLEESWWLLLRTVVLGPAGDSGGDLWSSCFPRPEPGAVRAHAQSLHDAYLASAICPCLCHCSAWLLGAQPRDQLCERSHSSFCPAGPSSLKSTPQDGWVTQLRTLPSPSHVA